MAHLGSVRGHVFLGVCSVAFLESRVLPIGGYGLATLGDLVVHWRTQQSNGGRQHGQVLRAVALFFHRPWQGRVEHRKMKQSNSSLPYSSLFVVHNQRERGQKRRGRATINEAKDVLNVMHHKYYDIKGGRSEQEKDKESKIKLLM